MRKQRRLPRVRKQDKPPSVIVTRRPGGSYNLTEAFAILRLSYSFGSELVKAEQIKSFRLGPGSVRIADDEIERIQREGLGSGNAA